MPASQETKSGTIKSFFDTDSGIINEVGTTSDLEFFQPGAQAEFVQGDSVTFLKVTLPNGKIIIRDIKKPTN